MKFQIVSDLHLEFQEAPFIRNAGADVLVLAGDICLAEHLYKNPTVGPDTLFNKHSYAKHALRYLNFFEQVSREFDTVIYIMGNHEHYSGLWNRTANSLREALDPFQNIILMNDAWINMDGIRIIGTSLWTDMDKKNPMTMLHIKDMMNDYHSIKIEHSGAYRKLRPLDTYEAHVKAFDTIKLGVETWDGPVVVLGHHAPSHRSIHPKYANQGFMNAAFVNSLDEYIIDHPQIKLWAHGHVHDRWDYVIGETRIICNPHGYPNEPRVWDPNLVVEIL